MPLCEPLSLVLYRGEMARLTGDNGVGKTTLLAALAGAYQGWSGVRKYRHLKPSLKLQGPSPFPSLSLEEMFSVLKLASEEEKRKALECLQLDDLIEKPMGLLSGGESQRCALALAVVRSHTLLLLDEPFVGLDQYSANLIRDYLVTTSRTRATVIVEHQQTLPLEVQKEIVLIRH